MKNEKEIVESVPLPPTIQVRFAKETKVPNPRSKKQVK